MLVCATDIEAVGTNIGDSGELGKVSTLAFYKWFGNEMLWFWNVLIEPWIC